MAINKRKVLDAARKHAQKGAKQRALKEYDKLVQADPRDAKLLLEIGDAYRRWGQAEEAVAQYTKVANQYKQDGFDARAVAVLKQILNLDPKRYTAHVSLAELYQRMGLDSDAVNALRTAADGYYREGRRKEALELLRKMAALDPSNTTSRLKVADLLHQEQMNDEAINEYREIVEELRRQGANEQICVVQERILELSPDDVATLTALARNLSDLGRPERAEPFAVRALERSREPEQFELLAGLYKSLGHDVKLAEVTRELAAYYKGRGDDDRAREVMQRLPSEALLDGPSIGVDQSEVEDADLGEDELLDDEDFLVTDATDQSELEPVPDVSEETDDGADEDDLPEGDPEQLLAEASVYLRYGKRAQAIASLRSALRQQPDHGGVLEKLGEAYAEDERADDAIGCWQRAAEVARADGDGERFAVLRDRIGALDPLAASEIEPMEAEAPPEADDTVAAADDPLGETGDFEFEIDVSETESPAADEDDADGLADLPDEDDAFEIDLDDEGAVDAAAPSEDDVELDDMTELAFDETGDETGDETDDETDAAADHLAAVEDDDGFEIDVEVDGAGDAPAADADVDLGLELADDGPGAAPTPGALSGDFGQSTTTAAQIREDLEEAEFYLQQGLSNEAEEIYRRILEVAPNHPTVLLKLGELVADRGEDPGAVTDPGTAAPAATADADPGLEIEFDLEADAVDDAAPVDAEDAEAEDAVAFEDPVEDEGPSAPELSDDLAAVLAEAEAAVEAATEPAPGPAPAPAPVAAAAPEVVVDDGIGDQLGEDSTEVEAVGAAETGELEAAFAAEPVQAEPVHTLADDTLPMSDDGAPIGDGATAAASQAGGEASFDLAAELADVFEEANADEEESAPAAPAKSTVEDGFESLFADFKKGVSATLDEGDYDTRFDLGIAYREMGLFDDAIAEFTACLGSEARKVESLHMMALCALELDRSADAVSHLEQALATGELPNDRLVALQFDLGRAQRRAGDGDAARRAFETVAGLDADFPGLAAERAALEAGGASPDEPIELAEPEEAFESFDDIMGDDEDDEPPAPPVAEAETFESFDDVITEVESADAPEAPGAGSADAPSAGSGAEDDTDPGSSRSGRKKKKISFV